MAKATPKAADPADPTAEAQPEAEAQAGFHAVVAAAAADAQQAGDLVSHGLLAQVETALHEVKLKIEAVGAQASEEVQALLAGIHAKF